MGRIKALLRKLRSGASAGDGKQASPSAEVAAPAGDPRAEDIPAFDPLAASFVDDPYPVFDALRRRAPVHRNAAGAWAISRHADVLEALVNPQLGNAPSRYATTHARNRGKYVCADVANHILPFQDPPAHTLPRGVIGRAFRAHLRERPIALEHIAREILAPLKQRERFDLLADFATPFSLRALCELLGVPSADSAKLAGWSEWFFYLFTFIPDDATREGLDAALAEFRTYLQAKVEERRDKPGADLISRLLAEGEDLEPQTIVDTCMLLFADGVENVDAAITNGFAALHAHPAELKALLDNPSLLPGAVEECLRFESPAQFVGRVALEDFELQGHQLKTGAPVLLLLGSANRDPECFDAPDELRVHREPNPHLSFGTARHACIGARLVRQEMAAAMGVLLEECPRMRIEDGPLKWQARLAHRWLEELWVRPG